jgi:DNA-binding beta-propeller fold protein YncE
MSRDLIREGEAAREIYSACKRGREMRRQFVSAIILLGALALLGSAAAPRYHLVKKFKLGGEGGWDYLHYDPAGKRLFIARATRVMVVDPEKGSILAEIPDTPGVHGIALAEKLGKGFTSNGRENTVTVFSLKTLREIAKIKVTGEGPDAIVYDPVSNRVFTFNGHSGTSTAIDAEKGTVAATIPLGGKPEFAVADGRGMVFANLEDKSELVSIDARKATVTHVWPLAPCEEPSGLAIDRKHRRLFAGCRNKLMAVVNADTGKVIAALPIGRWCDSTRFDPATQLAFSSNGDGTLTVIHEDSPEKFSVVQNAPTEDYARTMAVNPANHDVYLVTAEMEPAHAGERYRRVKPGTFTLLVMSGK